VIGSRASLLGQTTPGPRCFSLVRIACAHVAFGPSHWLFVVVHFNETPARIVTAYANRKRPDRMDSATMTVTIGSLTFDRVSYDARGDVLYLHVGDSQPAAGSEETPEGHVLRFDADGKVIGLTIINARLLAHDRAINVTVPEHVAVGPDALSEALAAA
jgi:uncharacterized protein YuzE